MLTIVYWLVVGVNVLEYAVYLRLDVVETETELSPPTTATI